MIDQRTKTDCLRCCIATVLGLPYEDVPDLVPEHGGDWPAALAQWACAHGLEALWFRCFGEGEMLQPLQTSARWIATGPTDRGTNHAVVYRGDAMEYDPHARVAGRAAGRHWGRGADPVPR